MWKCRSLTQKLVTVVAGDNTQRVTNMYVLVELQSESLGINL